MRIPTRLKTRRNLLVAKVGVATITYTILASPIACNLPAPSPAPEPADARASDGQTPSDAPSSDAK
jgi:hypothetical protein